MPVEVTDPALLSQLNGQQEVTDPAILSQLNGDQSSPGIGAWMKNNVGVPLARMGINAVTGLPMMAEDFGVAIRNVMAGRDSIGNYPYELPSHVVQSAMQPYLPAPTTPEGKLSEFAGSTILGGRMGPTGIGTSAPPIPANFQPSSSISQQTLSQAREAGYVFPPSTTNPTIANKALESLGGKIAMQQDASLANMPVTDRLARQALRLPDNTEFTPDVLKGVRAQAATASRDLIAKAGPTVNMDQQYADTITNITQPYRDAAAELGDSFGNTALVKSADAINKAQITPKVATTAITTLRDNATAAFRAGDNTTGTAYKALATNVEDAIDRHLVAQGNQGVVNAYRDARALQAQSYDVGDALNTATGHVNAGFFGKKLNNGGYLSGPLKTIGQSAQMAPKAMKEIVDSGAVHNTDVALGMVGAVAEHEPMFLLYPFARQAARAYMMSDSGQTLGAPGTAGPAYGFAGLAQSLMAQWDLAK